MRVQTSKNHNGCEKDFIWNPTKCSCENVEYLTSTIDNSVITCDEIKIMEIVYKKLDKQISIKK